MVHLGSRGKVLAITAVYTYEDMCSCLHRHVNTQPRYVVLLNLVYYVYLILPANVKLYTVSTAIIFF
eukprot:SAG31_NODE_511_length_14722_cov_14.770499_12_plen_67_part_00